MRHERAGSSPLARGLPPRTTPPPTRQRIIPARAGFTTPRRPGHAAQGDHPRSRGVYAPTSTTRAGDRGSSPLARGLQAAEQAGAAAEGIIPARAGFTWGSVATTALSRDHPRSRGVYVDGGAGHSGGGGIIPARAGFTSTRGRLLGRSVDHPRSRGVYHGFQVPGPPG